MPLPRTTRSDFTRHLDALGIAAGDRLAIHSRLLAFGDMEGGAAAVAQLLQDRVGEQGSLIVPSYTFDPSLPYDPRTRPGEASGALSEHIRQLPQARRSRCPIHNHAGIGPAAALLADSDPGCSLGPESDFDLMLRADFKLLLLGCGFSEGCTYLHHMEAMMAVPYRNWVTLERQVIDETGATQMVRVRYFVRAQPDRIADFEPVRQRLTERGLLASTPCVFGHSHVCRLADLHAVAAEMLTENPYALVGRS